jgi:hypothetical protein
MSLVYSNGECDHKKASEHWYFEGENQRWEARSNIVVGEVFRGCDGPVADQDVDDELGGVRRELERREK